MKTISRIIQRHLMPSFITSIYYLFRYGCFINPKAEVQFSSNITIGKNTVVKSYAVIQTALGEITIGNNCAISSFNHISTESADIRIGNYVRMGPHVKIIGSSRNYRRKDQLIVNQGYNNKGIEIGSDVFIGAGATILDGCTVGDGAVIGVGSIVNKDVPPYGIVFGVPAKIIFYRT